MPGMVYMRTLRSKYTAREDQKHRHEQGGQAGGCGRHPPPRQHAGGVQGRGHGRRSAQAFHIRRRGATRSERRWPRSLRSRRTSPRGTAPDRRAVRGASGRHRHDGRAASVHAEAMGQHGWTARLSRSRNRSVVATRMRVMTQGDVVVESVTLRGFENHMALELSGSLNWWDNDKFNHLGTARHAHGRRARIAQFLSVPQSSVRVISPGYLGASYRQPPRPGLGGSDRSDHGEGRRSPGQGSEHAQRGLRRAHAPRGEPHRVEDGGQARRHHRRSDLQGHRQLWRPPLRAATGAWIGFQRTYTIPNLKLDATDVFTNQYRYGSYRCVSHPFATWNQEILIDKAA